MPMIATAVGGIPEIIVGRESLLVEPEATSIAERMAEVLADPVDFERKMPSALELRARFGADVMASAIEKAYTDAIAV